MFQRNVQIRFVNDNVVNDDDDIECNYDDIVIDNDDYPNIDNDVKKYNDNDDDDSKPGR